MTDHPGTFPSHGVPPDGLDQADDRLDVPAAEGTPGDVRRGLHNRVLLRRRTVPRPEPAPAARRPLHVVQLPLTSAQQRLWFVEQLDGARGAYNIPLAIDIEGPLDLDAVTHAVDALVERHEALRCTFVDDDDGPHQVVATSAPIGLTRHDTTGEPDPVAAARQLITADALVPFDLSVPPLLRAVVVRTGENRHILGITTHHLVSDGWSLDVLRRDLLALYQAAASTPEHGSTAARQAGLEPLPLQFPDVVWGQQTGTGPGFPASSLAYWDAKLADLPLVLDLPIDRPRPPVQSDEGDRVSIDLDRELVEQLTAIGHAEGATLFMVLLAAFKVVLHRYGGAEDIVVGTSTANRTTRAVQPLIGLFANTVVLRDTVTGDRPFLDLLGSVRTTVLEAHEHQGVPVEELVERIRPIRSLAHAPLFQVMIELETARADSAVVGPLVVTPVALPAATAKFDLGLELRPLAGGLRADLEFRCELFERATAERLLHSYRRVLEAIAAGPRARIADLPLLDSGARQAIVHEWSGYPTLRDHRLAHKLFEEQVDRSPSAVAASCADERITYRELDERANRIAHALVGADVGADDRVVLAMERGIDYLAALLGVLKASAAFVPIDPAAPVARTAAMIAEASPAVILYASRRCPAEPSGVPVLSLADLATGSSPGRLRPATTPRGLAYAFFTSGSTGRPKAAMVEHAGMVNHLLAKVEDLCLGPDDVVAQIAVASFDVSVWQLLAPLVVGGRTAILTGHRAWNPAELLEGIVEEGITVVESVPSHTSVILDELAARPDVDLGALRMYISNGEPMPIEQARRWFAVTGVPLVNTFGVTECSDDTSHHHVPPGPLDRGPYVPIGGPLRGARTYILDEQLEPVPVGVTGEICIGDVAVGRGYLSDPARTAAAFVPDPLSGAPGARLYRTGDLARYRDDGLIDFVGRRDHQLKIRGFRVDLGEVEAALLIHDEVRDATVLAHGAAERAQLVAYVVPMAHPAPTPGALQSHCAEHLPAHMVPSAVVLFDELPLTASGKVDRNRLPPVPGDDEHGRPFVAPCTDIEQRLAALWRDALGVDRIGVHDDFFDRGGHSLLAARLLRPMRRVLPGTTLRLLFEHPRIAELVAVLGGAPEDGEAGAATEIVLRRGTEDIDSPVRLAPNQIAEWFAWQLDPSSPVYNISFANLFLDGLDVDRFCEAWQLVLDRHDVFRTTFTMTDGVPVQRCGPALTVHRADIELDRTNLSGEEQLDEARRLAEEEATAPFDLEAGPPFRLRLVRYGDGRHQLIFVVHHVIWDETSTMLLVNELVAAYNARAAGREPELPDLSLSYRDFAEWINTLVDSGALDQDRDYWLSVLRDPPAPLDLPTDYPRPAVQTYRGRTVASWLPRSLVRELRAFSHEHNCTLFMIVLAAIDAYLMRITGQRDLLIGCPIAGREDDRLERLLGLFASPLPIRCRIGEQDTFLDLVHQARARSADAMEHHRYPVNRVIEQLPLDKDLSRPQLYSVMYGLQNNKTDLLSAVHLDGVTITTDDLYNAEANGARFDLTFVLDELGGDVAFNCIYNIDLFTPETATGIVESVVHLLTAAMADPTTMVARLPLVDDDERSRLVELGHGPAPKVPLRPAPDQLDEAMATHPGQVAIVAATGDVSYSELDRRVGDVAASLTAAGVEPRARVALAVASPLDGIVGMLATWRLGASYVPLDPTGAAARSAQILDQVKPAATLATPEAAFALTGLATGSIVDVQAAADVGSVGRATAHDVPTNDAEAYVLFTSGTTGVPKGIPIAHRGVASLLASTQAAYGLIGRDRVLQLTPLTFDACLLEVVWPLIHGAAVVLADRDHDPVSVLDRATATGVTILQCVPAMLDALAAAVERGDAAMPPALRLIISGGSTLSAALLLRAQAVATARIVNHYGPTEACVDVCTFDGAEPFDGPVVPIGTPLPGAVAHVLDPTLEPTPLGVTGSLYVRTPGLTDGYLGGTEAGRFVTVDLGGGLGPERLYRSGDVAKRDRRGRIVFLGRQDKQAQVRGIRIEPEEVDIALQSHPLVHDAVTQAVEDGDGQSLVSFVELDGTVNRLLVGEDSFQVATLQQRPELAKGMSALHAASWPAYFEGDPTLTTDWPLLGSVFPHLQFVLATEDDELAAVGNAVPIHWSGARHDLPPGWAAALHTAVTERATQRPSNTLLILTGVVAESFQQHGLSEAILRAAKALARAENLERVAVVVRPTGKAARPDIGFEEWCARRRPDGQFEDAWLRIHERLGGTVAAICPRSQPIHGTVADWERWTGSRLTTSGPQVLPGTLQPAHVDLDAGSVTYDEPGVWVVHSPGDDEFVLTPVAAPQLRRFLRQRLPAYMVPDRIAVRRALPRLVNGKVDEQALRPPPVRRSAGAAPAENDRQSVLARIWCEVLSLPVVGIDDDFFELGGQSLRALQMLAAVERELGQRVPLRSFYNDTTIRGLDLLLVPNGVEESPNRPRQRFTPS